MKIVLVHGHLANLATWKKTARRLADDGIKLFLLHQFYVGMALEVLEQESPRVVLADLFQDQPGYGEILALAQKAPCRVALGPGMPTGFGTLAPEQDQTARQYFARLHPENYYQGMRYLAHLAGAGLDCREPAPVITHGIYHPQAPAAFSRVETYLDWLDHRPSKGAERNLVGLLCYHGQIVEENHAELDALIFALENKGLAAMCVYCEGMAEASLPMRERYPWLAYLRAAKPRLVAMVSALAGRFLANREDLPILEELDVPVFQGIRLHRKSVAEWQGDPQGLSSMGLVYSLAQPETAGAMEPTLLACEETGPDGSHAFEPVRERVERLAGRVRAWARLRKLAPGQKKVALVLHNNPCRGVEATAGQAVGLDAAQSAVEIMQRLLRAGYRVEDIPKDGRALMDLIQEKKALSEFRWTTVDQVVGKGGALHLMPKEEYQLFFSGLPGAVQNKVREDWGPFPGQGMVLEKHGEPHLVISGLRFGNLTLLIQPKRGCYGAKCNGEVCRILHDPAISPPHHWLATYKYLQDRCCAVIHLGAEGALEYLPGKRAALSGECFPEISLGDLPNLYVYVMDAPGEGLLAKRRARAVMVDHLVPPRRPAPAAEAAQQIKELLAQHGRAEEMADHARRDEIKKALLPLLRELKFLADEDDEEQFREALQTATRQLAASQAGLISHGLHVLGLAPKGERLSALLANMLEKPPRGLPSLKELCNGEPGTPEAFEGVCARLLVEAESGGREALPKWLAEQTRKLKQSALEIDRLAMALSGRFVAPGLGGSLSLGQHEALPTGRNFFAQDVTRLPSEAARAVGMNLADQLLNKFLAEEGRFPQSVGISLWSSDAFKCDGEVCAQVLHLLGVEPVRDSQGRVSRVEALPLDKLLLQTPQGLVPRPRVDVLVQTSGVLRDMVPNFVELLDRAARLVNDLDEPPEWNPIRGHNQERLAQLGQGLADGQSGALRRLVASRVFSSEPGSYGLGVGLAMDASAWESRQDLAEVYVNWGGWAYGNGEFGQRAREVFAAHLGGIEISYMKQASPEYDLLDCSGYADFQGGMAAAAGALAGKGPKLYWGGDDSNGGARVVDLKDELERAVRTRLLSQHWLEALKEHGAQGAMEVVNKVLTVYRWSATSGTVAEWAFEAITEHLLMKAENRDWLQKQNPHALEEMTRRLLEAESRGLWRAGPEHKQALREAALDLEGDLEEAMGAVEGEFQGSQVEVITARDVDAWNPQWRIK